jgi:predicted transcriptional regulator
MHNLAKNLGIDHKTVEHYVSILASVGLIRESLDKCFVGDC